jgi:hypothetical protein
MDKWFKLLVQGVEGLSSFALHKGNVIVDFDIAMTPKTIGYVGSLQARWSLRSVRAERR